MATRRVVVIGAGMAGLAAALELAAHGLAVTVVERADTPGGKMREVQVGRARLDAGPTVFTMRRIFDELFAAAGATLSDHIRLRPAEILARHAWSERERLDLFADVDRSADAVAALAGPAEGRGFRAFSQRAARIYRTLEHPFIRAARPTPLALVRNAGPGGLADLWRISPFATLWQALGEHFQDPRLRQLFGRYATYCGSSPFLAPATLMLIAHVEQDGVWLIEGGMHRLALALARIAALCGATFHYGAEAARIVVRGARAAGVELATGERIEADAVVVNADVAAISRGRLGHDVMHAVRNAPDSSRSLSAVTWSLLARAEGFPLLRHTVFFSTDYAREFDDIFQRAQLPAEPTVYVCAQDRDDRDGVTPHGLERLFCLVNAPPVGDAARPDAAQVERCEERTFARLARCGLHVQRRPETSVITTPADFDRLFPATGGALYGQAAHGWRASFTRPGSRCRIPGLYLAGGSTHPGPGVPMAALSGRLAAACVLADLDA
jgi:1-hydroxycarotenoid 3,4-desaturase